MNRRDFLKVSSISASVLTLDLMIFQKAEAARDPRRDINYVRANGFSILQGLTTATTTQLTVDVPKTMTVHYELRDISNGRLIDPFYFKSVSRAKPTYRVDKLGYTNLPYLGKFIFRVLDDKGTVLDERYLGLVDLNKLDARIAIMSCMNSDNKNREKIWPRVEAANCDMLFFIGDHVYGDLMLIFDSPDMLWDKYIEHRQLLQYYHWKNLKPAVVIWDDHDYGANNADGTYKYKNDSLVTYKAFTAQEPIAPEFEDGPGVSCLLRAFGQKFMLLDNRWFRYLKYDGITGFLGKEQIQWALSKMTSGSEPNWIIEGSQFFQSGKDCYRAKAAAECEIFARGIGKLNSPSIFAAGDVHYSEFSHAPKEWLGYDTYEITSSCLHSRCRKKLPKNNHRILGAVQENFTIVDLLPSRNDLVFDLKNIGINKINFEKSISI